MTKTTTHTALDSKRFYEELGEKSVLDRYWTSGFGRNIHIARCKTLGEFLEIHSPANSEPPLLDLGCGDGTVSIWLAKNTRAIIVGCDISTTRVTRALAQAKRQRVLDQVDFLVCDIHSLPFRLGSLSRIFSSEVFEHINDVDGALKQVFDVLSSSGTFVLGVPQEGSLLSKLRYRLWSPILSRPFGGGYDVGHQNKYTASAVWRKLRDQGFEVTRVRGIGLIIPFMPLHYLALWVAPLFWIANKFGRRFPTTGDMLVFKTMKKMSTSCE